MKSGKNLSFGSFRLDLANELLLQGSRPIRLRSKTFAFLHYLAERPGRLVTKQELLHNLWPDCTVGDNSLTHSILEIRKALGDDAQSPRFIETAHRKGYRFIGKVSTHRKPIRKANRPGKGKIPKLDFAHEQFVGREQELAQLYSCFEQAIACGRRVVFVTGEQGIGKTALVGKFLSMLDSGLRISHPNWEFAKTKQQSRIGIARGRCVDFHGPGEAYLPVLEALTELCRQPNSARFFARALRRHAPLWCMQIPLLASNAGPKPFQRPTLGIPPERMLREIAEALEAFSMRMPLVLLIEDLHWGDHSTIDMINYVARRQSPARLMLIGTYRPSEIAANLNPLITVKRDLQIHLLCSELRLTPLDELAVGQYIMSKFRVNDFPAAFREWIHRRTEGNPLFMANLLDHLSAKGIIVLRDKSLALTVEIDTLNTEVPPTIQEMVELQILQCGEEKKLILQAGSVEGLEFSTDAVAFTLDRQESLIEAACEKMARQNMIIQPGNTLQLPNGRLTSRYKFKNALYQNICYRGLTQSGRMQFHKSMAEYSELIFNDTTGEGAARLAMHLELGREYARAIKYYQKAADHANRQYAAHEAAELARTGLRLIQASGDVPGHIQQELGLLLALGRALMWTEGFGRKEVKDVFARIMNLCEQCGESKHIISALFGLWLCCSIRAEYEAAEQFADKLLQLAETQKNPLLLSEIHFIAGVTFRFRGELELALRHFDEGNAIKSSQKEDDFCLLDGKDPVIGCLSFAALVKWRLGYPDQALKMANEALTLAQETRHPKDLVFASATGARLYRLLRNSNKALELIETAIAVAHKQGWKQLVVDGSSIYGSALASLGRANEAIDKMRRALLLQEEIGSLHMKPELLGALAEALGDTGQSEEALAAVDQAIAAIHRAGMRHIEPDLYLLKGDLLLKKSEEAAKAQAINGRDNLTNQAGECFYHALAVARLQKAKSMELRGAIRSARLLHKQNRHAEAVRQLQAVYNWFTEGHDTPDLQDARALLQQLSHCRDNAMHPLLLLEDVPQISATK